jgi:hypothetical protein
MLLLTPILSAELNLTEEVLSALNPNNVFPAELFDE